MKKIAIKILVNAVAIWVATVVPGVALTDATVGRQIETVLFVAVIFGVINTVIKPIVKLATLPLFLLTLGLITIVINAAMLGLTSWAAGKLDLAFHVSSVGAAILGALVVSVVSMILNVAIRD